MTKARALGILWLALGACGCSSDAVDAPEPTLKTPGAFVAQQIESGEFRLLRTLSSLKLENQQTVILFRIYAPRASSFEAARELAKQPDLQVEMAAANALESEFVTSNWRVVWFRTFGEDERDTP